MKYLILLSVLLSSSLMAFEPGQFEQEFCQNMVVPGSRSGFYSVRRPQVFRGNAGRYYLQKITYKNETFFAVTSPNNKFQLKAPLKSVADFVVADDRIWLLSGMELIEFNQRGRELSRYQFSASSNRHEAPRGLAISGEDLLIAHGSLGLVSFNRVGRTFSFLSEANTVQEDGRRSKTTSIVVKDQRAFVSLTGNMQYAFNGIVVIDLNTNTIENAAEYRQARHGVVDPHARIYFYGGEFYLNNGGWIHQFSERDLLTKEFPRPHWLPIRYAYQDRNRFLRIEGDFVLEGNVIYGCAVVDRNATVAQRQL